MALSQLFWDVLMPWNLKSTYFSLKMIHFLSLNIWYVIHVVFWIKYWNLKLPHHCILFLFTICTVSQLFWNRVCIYISFFIRWHFSANPGIDLVNYYLIWLKIVSTISPTDYACMCVRMLFPHHHYSSREDVCWLDILLLFFYLGLQLSSSIFMLGQQHSRR